MNIVEDRKKAIFIPENLLINVSDDGIEYASRVFHSLGEIVRKSDFDFVLIQSSLDEKAFEKVERDFSQEGIFFNKDIESYDKDLSYVIAEDKNTEVCCKAIKFTSWPDVAAYFTSDEALIARTYSISRTTKETDISLVLNLDGCGNGRIDTGIGFYDHMLEQVKRHSRFDIDLSVKGDLKVDEHHSIEDAAIVFGEGVKSALGDKRGIERYGYEIVVMDEVTAIVALDFSSRPELVWNVEFTREYIGDFPTELFRHFFRSFSSSSGSSVYVSIESCGDNHHMAEAIFKAFGRALRRAVKRIYGDMSLPTTKGCL